MTAYVEPIVQPKCSTCGRIATVELHNNRNARIGKFCGPCGARALKEQQESEDRRTSGMEPVQ